MTLGERIQMLRKEKGLSQEALGDLLGVTRQSISKWESDLTVPELDKLIALSKQLGVSIGMLLGLEEGEQEKELTERELAALEAIAARLSPAPALPARRKRRWPKVLALLLCAILAGSWLSNWTQNMENRIQSLYNSNTNMENRISNQIHNISDQVESILERQNSVTAEEEYTLVDLDLRKGVAHYELRAVPRDYVEGMTAVFSARSAGEVVTCEAEFSEVTKTFTGKIACPLTDDITLSVAFEAGGQTQIRVLGNTEGLLQSSHPGVSGSVPALWGWEVQEDGSVSWLAPSIHLNWWEGRGVKSGEGVPVTLEKASVRLWENGEMTRELGELKLEEGKSHTIWQREETITFTDLQEGDTVIFSARCTDSYGRSFEAFLEGYVVENGRLEFCQAPEGMFE